MKIAVHACKRREARGLYSGRDAIGELIRYKLWQSKGLSCGDKTPIGKACEDMFTCPSYKDQNPGIRRKWKRQGSSVESRGRRPSSGSVDPLCL